MHKLEDLLPGDKISKINVCDAVVFDGHAVIQMLAPPSTSIKTTFKEMASRFCKYTMQTVQHMEPTDELQIHIIFDNYLESTIKKTTRVKRGESDRGIVYHIQTGISIPPNWKQFLTKGENKTKLPMFYTEYMVENEGATLDEKHSLYISGGQVDKVVKITKEDTLEVEALKSNHEEADTRIVVHAKTAAQIGAEHIVVCSPDTDVLVLLVHHYTTIAAKEIFLLTGRVGRRASLTRYIPVHRIYENLEKKQHNIMLSVYCLTGCDTVSSFRGHGKRTAYR